MKKVLVGATLGVAIGYFIRKMQEEKQFDKAADIIVDWAAKTKKKAKNVMDMAENEAEYLKEKATHAIEKGKAKFAKEDKAQEKVETT